MKRLKEFILSVMPKKLLGYLSAYAYRPIRSYSGGGEDCVTEKIFSGKSTGFYVDVGCFHPTVASNTYRLYRKGWRGINIDADQYKIDLFRAFRRRDANICVAISDAPGEAEFFFQGGGTYGSVSGLIRSEIERRAEALGRTVGSRKVATLPLSALLQKEGVSRIDYLSIDVEGAEDLVLSTLDFSNTEVDVIAVEIHGDFKAVLSSNVQVRLGSRGYEIIAWTPPTVFYRKSPLRLS